MAGRRESVRRKACGEKRGWSADHDHYGIHCYALRQCVYFPHRLLHDTETLSWRVKNKCCNQEMDEPKSNTSEFCSSSLADWAVSVKACDIQFSKLSSVSLSSWMLTILSLWEGQQNKQKKKNLRAHAVRQLELHNGAPT